MKAKASLVCMKNKLTLMHQSDTVHYRDMRLHYFLIFGHCCLNNCTALFDAYLQCMHFDCIAQLLHT